MTDKTPAMPERFTKKPVTIEAVQFTEALRDAVILDAVPLPEGIKFGRANYNLKDRKVWSADFYIETLEGRMKVDIGDWIIKGVKGEFYPCKPGIFELTYDRAALQSAQPAEVVSDAEIERVFQSCGGKWDGDMWVIEDADFHPAIRAILARRPQAVPMTDRVFDLICNAIDEADTLTMEGDYMMDSDDCIAVVRVMQALLHAHHGITQRADGGEVE